MGAVMADTRRVPCGITHSCNHNMGGYVEHTAVHRNLIRHRCQLAEGYEEAQNFHDSRLYFMVYLQHGQPFVGGNVQ